MTDFLPIATLVLLVVSIALLILLLRKAAQTDISVLVPRLDAFEKAQERTERAVREEVAQSRDELGKAAREQRQELTEAFKIFGDSVVQRMMDVASIQKGQLDAFSGQLTSFAQASGERLDSVRSESAAGAKQLREEVVATLKSISETMAKTMSELANVQRTQLEAFSGQLATFAKASGERLDGGPPVSLERLAYDRESQQVFYQGKDQTSTYDPIDFLAYASLHIPDKGEQLLRYYGWYSNKSRGLSPLIRNSVNL
jgi:DNA recombination protein RmuC